MMREPEQGFCRTGNCGCDGAGLPVQRGHGRAKDRVRGALLLLVASVAGLGVLGVEQCQPPFTTYELEMRDGVRLMTDVFEASSSRPSPTLVIRTPYTRETNRALAEGLADSGYSVVSQDIRGTGASEGTFMMFLDDGWGANQDGFDTVEWATLGGWSNGEACLWGGSALAITALLASGAVPPSLTCAYSLVGTGDVYQQATWQGGALRQELVVNWLTDLGALEALDTVYAHPLDDGYWDPVTLSRRFEAVHTAIYHMGGWYDIFSQGTLDGFVGLHNHGAEGARGNQKLLMGPWTHGGTSGELAYPDSALPMGEDLRWFEYWLKGSDDGIGSEAPVKYYLMGDPTDSAAPGNVWLTADNWPVPSTPTAFFLLENGTVQDNAPTAQDTWLEFSSDPANPVPTVGGANLYLEAGTFDQRPTLERSDVLYFESAVLEQPVAMAGRITAKLWVSSDARDTDFAVKLMDVYPDGAAMLVQDGILRMRSREGQDREVFMTPGEVYAVEVDLWSSAIVFNSGHRIGVAISGSNYPRFDVNPNTGGPIGETGPGLLSQQMVYVDSARPTHIILPVIDLPDSGPDALRPAPSSAFH